MSHGFCQWFEWLVTGMRVANFYLGGCTQMLWFAKNGLPKIHKKGSPLRPIVSSIGSITYKVQNAATHLVMRLPKHCYQ